MKDGRRGIRCNYNSINIFLRHVPISEQVSLYPSAFLSSNKLLSVLIIRPALRGGDRGREEAQSPKEGDLLKQKTIAISITALSENRGAHRWLMLCFLLQYLLQHSDSRDLCSTLQSPRGKTTSRTPRGTTKLILLQKRVAREHITANVPTR